MYAYRKSLSIDRQINRHFCFVSVDYYNNIKKKKNLFFSVGIVFSLVLVLVEFNIPICYCRRRIQNNAKVIESCNFWPLSKTRTLEFRRKGHTIVHDDLGWSDFNSLKIFKFANNRFPVSGN